ncbi:hypothetical protein Poli38472_000671 [Pythium oligandrum]|uniref:Carboxypeptidase n=1 Tax=Pythium oligandrum TaxID=41045 RepID=A0A8K1FH38_PYTOL|nr:hypothetical protein Poli38472_000671 [Pythium oligandrum]|eukprot:TMW60629.1 hypothetical protein Poli38472_000671 [Pythium oligandrum]
MRSYTPIGPQPLATRASTFAKYALGFAATLVVGSLLVSDTKTATTSPLRAVQVLSKTENATFPGAEDLIQELYGKPEEYTSRLFSGYLPIGNGGQAFYFYAESQSDKPEEDPVLLWLNGGPGASSLAGCFTENGPLLVNDDGESLRVNEYGWNKASNFLCIESPVGVGFSYNASGVYESDDLKQADELYLALQQFFDKFPWLRENDFIISGESYGGIYVPTTAKRIVEGNLAGDAKINLKKFVVGNGVNEFMGLSMILYAYYHGLMSTADYKRIRTDCPNLKEFEPSSMFDSLNVDSPCAKTTLEIMTKLFTARINSYNIYGTCAGSTEESIKELVKEVLAPRKGYPHPIGNPMNMCLNSTSASMYFNLPDVREGVHTKKELAQWDNDALTSQSIDIFGKMIGLNSSRIEEIKATKLLGYTGTLKSVVRPLWKFLLAHDVEGVIYHGDVDMVCDFIGGLWAVESMQLERRQERTTWTVEIDGEEQTAGFLEDFGALKYLTVKGAGHLVPMWKPVEAKKMLDLFVLN